MFGFGSNNNNNMSGSGSGGPFGGGGAQQQPPPPSTPFGGGGLFGSQQQQQYPPPQPPLFGAAPTASTPLSNTTSLTTFAPPPTSGFGGGGGLMSTQHQPFPPSGPLGPTAIPFGQPSLTTPQQLHSSNPFSSNQSTTATTTSFGGSGFNNTNTFNTTTTSNQNTTNNNTASPFGMAPSTTNSHMTTTNPFAPPASSSSNLPFSSQTPATAPSSSLLFGQSTNIVAVPPPTPAAPSSTFGGGGTNTTTSWPTTTTNNNPFGTPAFSSSSSSALGGGGGGTTTTTTFQPTPFGVSPFGGSHPSAAQESYDDGMMDDAGTSQPPASNLPFGRPFSHQAAPAHSVVGGNSPFGGPASSSNYEETSSKKPSTSAAAKDEELAKLQAKIEAKKRKVAEQKQKAAAAAAAAAATTTGSSLRPDAPPFQPASSTISTTTTTAEASRAMRFAVVDADAAASRSNTNNNLLPSDLLEQSADITAAQTALRNAGGRAEREHLHDATSLIGTCAYMCPDEELLRRERESDVQLLERPIPDGVFHPTSWTLRDTMVKRFRRSAADYKLDVPEWVRPPDVLERVCGYLEEWVMERDRQGHDPRYKMQPPPLDVYQFIWDRTRMVRKDFILQNFVGNGGQCDARAVRCHERVARWHTMCEHQLSHISDFVVMQSQQNVQELGQTMKTLNQFYDDALSRALVEVPDENGNETRLDLSQFDHGCGSAIVQGQSPVDYDDVDLQNTATNVGNRCIGKEATLLPNHGTAEPEMRALYIVLTMGNDGGMEVLKYAARLYQERPVVYHTQPVQLALSIFKAKTDMNYTRFFSLLSSRSTPYLIACLMFKHVEAMRRVAFKICSRTYGSKSQDRIVYDTYPLQRLTQLLCFEDDDETREACRHYNITVVIDGKGHEMISWRSTDFREPKDPDKGTVVHLRPRKMLRTIESKLKGATRLAVCRGEASGEGAFLTSEQIQQLQSKNGSRASPSVTVNQDFERANALRRMKEKEEQRALVEKKRQEEIEAQRQQEDRQRKELQQRQIAQQEEKRRLEEIKRRQQQAELQEQQRLQREQESRRIAEEREIARQRAEEEERQKAIEAERLERRRQEEERRLQEEAFRKRQEEERLLREAEILRKQKEHEAELRRQEDLRQQEMRRQEALERQRKEAEERKRQKMLKIRMETAKKALVWRRFIYKTKRVATMAKTLEAMSSLQSSRYLHSSFPDNTSHTSKSIDNIAESKRCLDLRWSLERYLSNLQDVPTLNEWFADAVRSEFETRYSPSRIAGASVETFLFRILVVFPPAVDTMEYCIIDLIRSWICTLFDFDRVAVSRSKVLDVRIVLVNEDTTNPRTTPSDAALVVLPPSWSRHIIERTNELTVMSSRIGDGVPRIVFSMGDFVDLPLSDNQKNIKENILSCMFASKFGRAPVATNDDVTISHLDHNLRLCFNHLVGALVDSSPPQVERISIGRVIYRCVSELMWEDNFQRSDHIMKHAQEAINTVLHELDAAGSQVLQQIFTWPSTHFVTGINGRAEPVIRNYFGVNAPLPLNWPSASLRSKTEPDVLRYERLLDGPFASVIERLIADAPADVQWECHDLLEHGYARRSLQVALDWRVRCDEMNGQGHFVYLLWGQADRIFRLALGRGAEDLVAATTTTTTTQYEPSRAQQSRISFTEDLSNSEHWKYNELMTLEEIDEPPVDITPPPSSTTTSSGKRRRPADAKQVPVLLSGSVGYTANLNAAVFTPVTSTSTTFQKRPKMAPSVAAANNNNNQTNQSSGRRNRCRTTRMLSTTVVVSQEVSRSMSFTKQLERLLHGDEIMDVILPVHKNTNNNNANGGANNNKDNGIKQPPPQYCSTLSAALRGAPPPIDLSR